jgi:hypothetical protein
MKRSNQSNLTALLAAHPEIMSPESSASLTKSLSHDSNAAGWCLPSSIQGVDTVCLLSSLEEQLDELAALGPFLGKYTFLGPSNRRHGGVTLLGISEVSCAHYVPPAAVLAVSGACPAAFLYWTQYACCSSRSVHLLSSDPWKVKFLGPSNRRHGGMTQLWMVHVATNMGHFWGLALQFLARVVHGVLVLTDEYLAKFVSNA